MQLLQMQFKAEVSEILTKVSTVVKRLSEGNVALVQKYSREMTLRKKLHNELVELRGNIRVFCRVRPSSKEDTTKEGLKTDPEKETVTICSKDRKLNFEFDYVFDQTSTQVQLFDEAKALVISAVDGFKISVIAYGQTGSGKTFTMEGVAENPGLNQRTINELFDQVKKPDWAYTVAVAVLEIQKEKLRDLVTVGNDTLEIKLRSGGE